MPEAFDFATLLQNRENLTHNTIADWKDEHNRLKQENALLHSRNTLRENWRIGIKAGGIVLIALHLWVQWAEKSDSFVSPIDIEKSLEKPGGGKKLPESE